VEATPGWVPAQRGARAHTRKNFDFSRVSLLGWMMLFGVCLTSIFRTRPNGDIARDGDGTSVLHGTNHF
jgi:hypothetical protein